MQYINKIVYSMDEPFYSTVSPSTYFLAQNASKYVKGVLTGDGSDELVFGYKYLRSSLNTDDIIGSYLQGMHNRATGRKETSHCLRLNLRWETLLNSETVAPQWIRVCGPAQYGLKAARRAPQFSKR